MPSDFSYKVATTLTIRRIVCLLSGTANTVAYPENNQRLPLGITTDDVSDTNQAIPVRTHGPAFLLFNDTITAGQLVKSDSSGRGVPFTLANTTTALTLASAYVGHALGAVTATGTIERVHVNPGFDRE
jgi:hypothetical protein